MPDFLPMGQVTGIGSLPFQHGDDAVAFVRQHSPRLPFLPELPQRTPDEESIARVLAPVAALLTRRNAGRFDVAPGKIDLFCARLDAAPAELVPTRCAALPAFERGFASGAFAQAQAVKFQLVGAMTLAYSLFYEDQSFAAEPTLRVAIQRYLLRLARGQIERFSAYGLPVLLFFDEPCLFFHDRLPGGAETRALLADGIRDLQTTGAMIGVHSCAHGVLPALLALRPNMVSFDAHIELEQFLALPEAAAFLEQGGIAALGWIPTWDDLGGFDPAREFLRAVMAQPDEAALERLARQSLITATCGLGLLTADAARQSFDAAHRLASLLRRARIERSLPAR